MSADDVIFTTEEMAEKLKVSPDKVRDLVNIDGMPAIRINKRLWRFHWKTVLEWLNKR